MAVAIMLSRSTSRVAAVAVAGRQYFFRSGFSTAVNLSRLIIPTTRVSFARQFSSSVTRSSPSCDDSVGNQKLTLDESVVKDLLSQLQSMNDELQAIKNAKANEELRVKEKEEEKKEEVVVKQKDVVVAEIDSEISRIRIQGKKEILPEWFPFKVRKDKPGVPEITLSRVYKDETITIKVKNPWINVIDQPLATNYEFLAECGHFQMPLIVEISIWLLFSSKSIEFHCTAKRDRIVIEKLRHPADESDKGGVLFHTLDNKLCEEITKYLEARDIMPETTEYLYRYMLNKMNRENNRGLQKFKELIEAAA